MCITFPSFSLSSSALLFLSVQHLHFSPLCYILSLSTYLPLSFRHFLHCSSSSCFLFSPQIISPLHSITFSSHNFFISFCFFLYIYTFYVVILILPYLPFSFSISHLELFSLSFPPFFSRLLSPFLYC